MIVKLNVHIMLIYLKICVASWAIFHLLRLAKFYLSPKLQTSYPILLWSFRVFFPFFWRKDKQGPNREMKRKEEIKKEKKRKGRRGIKQKQYVINGFFFFLNWEITFCCFLFGVILVRDAFNLGYVFLDYLFLDHIIYHFLKLIIYFLNK